MIRKKKKDIIILEPTRYNPSYLDGLSDTQINERISNGLINKNNKKRGKSYFEIIIKNFCTLFNFLYVAIFVLLFTSQKVYNKFSIMDYSFVIVVSINILMGTIQEIKSKITISKLRLISTPTVSVIRDKELKEVKVDEVVLDDIVYLSQGKQITTDSILINGEVEVNESQLTGESVPIRKSVGDTLFSGSFIVSGNCYARVDKIGEDNQIEKLASLAKAYKQPNSQILSTVKKLIKVIAFFLITTGIIMILQNYDFEGFKDNTSAFGRFMYNDLYLGFIHKIFKNGASNWYETISSTCTALLGMIPSGLLMMTSGALVLGVIRLSKHQTLVQDIYCVEMLARVDVLCLDKTGTITNGQMNVVNFVDLSKKKYNIPDVIACMNKSLGDGNATSKSLEKYFGVSNKYESEYVIPFSSDRKYSAVKLNGETFILGAPEFVLLKGYEKHQAYITKEANKGYRILCLAVTNQDLQNKTTLKSPKAIAFILIEDQIRPEAEETIRYFRESGVSVKVISGDNPVTVSEVAKRVGIANAENFVSLDGLSDEEVYEVANEYTVFGRVKPSQKQIIVKALKDNKKTVAMTGDGVNDILALKEADCSIAMASGSDAVRNVAQLVLLDSNFASMPKVVDEGRRAINNVQQISMLFLVKTFFILTLSLLTITGFFKLTSNDGSFPFNKPTQLLMLELFVIGIPSVFLTIQPNKKRVSGNFLWNVLQKSLPGVVAIVVSVIVTYSLCKFCGFNLDPDRDVTKTIVVITATYIGLMILYLACKPFSVKKTILFVSMVVLCTFISMQAMNIGPRIPFVTDIIIKNFDLKPLYFVEVVNGATRYNLTPALLTICMVALSFIIMSICSYIITLINKLSLVRNLNKTKKILLTGNEESLYIEKEDED